MNLADVIGEGLHRQIEVNPVMDTNISLKDLEKFLLEATTSKRSDRNTVMLLGKKGAIDYLLYNVRDDSKHNKEELKKILEEVFPQGVYKLDKNGLKYLG